VGNPFTTLESEKLKNIDGDIAVNPAGWAARGARVNHQKPISIYDCSPLRESIAAVVKRLNGCRLHRPGRPGSERRLFNGEKNPSRTCGFSISISWKKADYAMAELHHFSATACAGMLKLVKNRPIKENAG